MSFLYITEQGAKLRKSSHRLIVEKDGEEIQEIECFRVKTILIFGNVQVTTQALTEILNQGVELAFLSEDGMLKGQLTPPLPKNIDIRIRQQERSKDPHFVLSQAKRIVHVKIRNSLELLKQADWNDADRSLQDSRSALEDQLRNVEKCDDLDQLRGCEGAAARAYFGAFPVLLKERNLFHGRSRRPPEDPVNAVLSFGYVLLVTKLQSLLDGVGFDPFRGFLHDVSYGRPSLALDLLEPYRAPIVDRLVVKLFNLKRLQADDFEEDTERGFRLLRPAMKRFFQSWEEFLNKNAVRRAMQRQVETLAQAIKGEREFPEHFQFKAD